jgi:hypothetical protein
MPESGATRARSAGGADFPAAGGNSVSLDTITVPSADAPVTVAHRGYFEACDFGGERSYHCSMRRFLPPRQTVWLLVAGLLCLMAAGVASMRKFGPPRGHVYAAVHTNR